MSDLLQIVDITTREENDRLDLEAIGHALNAFFYGVEVKDEEEEKV